MPSPYRRDVPRLKAQILARVGAGEALRGIGTEAGMPGAQTVRNWARADVGFASELSAARRHAGWMKRCAYDQGKAAVFLARAGAGETIGSLLGAPGLPSAANYRHWKASFPPFAEAARALLKRRDARLGAQGRARRRAWDPVLADRIIVGLNKGVRLDDLLAADPALPSRPILTRWRREQPAFDRVLRIIFAAWRRRRPATARMPQARIDAVAAHIVEGGSFASFSRLPGGPSRTTLRRWVRVDAGFAAAVAVACEHREHWYEDQIQMASEAAGPADLIARRRIGRLKRQLTRLRHRPGTPHRHGPRADKGEPDGVRWDGIRWKEV